MAATSWKSAFQNQEMVDTKIFTWRLRPHSTHFTSPTQKNVVPTLNPARNSKSSNGVAKPVSAPTHASHSLSSSVLPTATSLLQFQHQQHQLEKFLRFQEFEIEAGQTLGLHSMWSFFLISCGSPTTSGASNQRSNTNVTATATSSSPGNPPSANSDFIGLFLRKIMKPAKSANSTYLPGTKGDEIVARYKIEIMDRDGDILFTKEFESPSRDKLEVGFWDWKKIVPLSKFYGARGKLHGKEAIGNSLEEMLLLLRVSFTLASRRKESVKGEVADGSQPSHADISVRDAANAFLGLVTNSKSLQPDVVIEIPNRRKFSVHKKILVERSPFFLKALGPADTNVGVSNNRVAVMKVEDFSVNTVELILKHIYTGQLEEEWTTNPVTITELIYASDKYGLPALKEFCSKHMVKAATKNNCYKLMELAQTHNLEQAAEDLMSYVAEGIASTPNSRKSSEESVKAD